MLCSGRWQTIKSIAAYRAFLLTAESAARQESNEGYVYRLSVQ
jgi:hypothetical protein